MSDEESRPMPMNRVVESDIDTLCDECGGGTEVVTHYMTGWDAHESYLMLVSGDAPVPPLSPLMRM